MAHPGKKIALCPGSGPGRPGLRFKFPGTLAYQFFKPLTFPAVPPEQDKQKDEYKKHERRETGEPGYPGTQHLAAVIKSFAVPAFRDARGIDNAEGFINDGF
jgi:hypothetical protein